MKAVTYEFESKASIATLAQSFKALAENQYSGGRKILLNLVGARGELRFFTPTKDDVFGEFEDKIDYSAGVSLPTTSMMRGKNTTAVVHMYVTDTGNTRKVRLSGPYAFGERRATENALRRIGTGLQAV